MDQPVAARPTAVDSQESIIGNLATQIVSALMETQAPVEIQFTETGPPGGIIERSLNIKRHGVQPQCAALDTAEIKHQIEERVRQQVTEQLKGLQKSGNNNTESTLREMFNDLKLWQKVGIGLGAAVLVACVGFGAYKLLPLAWPYLMRFASMVRGFLASLIENIANSEGFKVFMSAIERGQLSPETMKQLATAFPVLNLVAFGPKLLAAMNSKENHS